MSKDFGSRVREARNALGLTQVELIDRAGLTYYSAISKIESGAMSPSFSDAVKLSDALGVSLDYLAGRESNVGSLSMQSSKIALQAARARIDEALNELWGGDW